MDEDKQGMKEPLASKPKRRLATQKFNVLGIITTAAGITFLSWAYKQWRLGISAAPHRSRALTQSAKTNKAGDPTKPSTLKSIYLVLKRALRNFFEISSPSFFLVALAAAILLLAGSSLREDIATVASQALSGLSSVPLMAASIVLISVSSILLIAITAALPPTCIKVTEFLYKSYNQIVDFSAQLPIAIAAVALPEAFKRAVTFSSVTSIYYYLWLLIICGGIAMLERTLAHLVYRICRAPKVCEERFGTVIFALAALLALLVVAVDTIEWKQVTDQEKIHIERGASD